MHHIHLASSMITHEDCCSLHVVLCFNKRLRLLAVADGGWIYHWLVLFHHSRHFNLTNVLLKLGAIIKDFSANWCTIISKNLINWQSFLITASILFSTGSSYESEYHQGTAVGHHHQISPPDLVLKLWPPLLFQDISLPNRPVQTCAVSSYLANF